MPSLKDMRGKAREAGLMKLDKLIATRQRIPNCGIPIPIRELCERYEKFYTGVLCIPREIAYDVLLRAEEIERNEIDIFRWVRQGDTISEIIDKGGFF